MGDPYRVQRGPRNAPPVEEEREPEPPQPRGDHERRMLERGARAGYLEGRFGGSLMARIHPAGPCPYPDEGRPRALWLAGRARGVPAGWRDREIVRASFLAGLQQLEAGAPASWA